MTHFHDKKKGPGQPAWEEAAKPGVLAAVNHAAKMNDLDAETRGKLLHHVNDCPKCLNMIGVKK